jgi:hypothetical protein
VHDPERARAVAAHAIRSAAEVKNNPADLINVALEMLVRESLELPAFSTLDAMVGRIRREVNTSMFERIGGRGGRHGRGSASRSRICDGSTRSATEDVRVVVELRRRSLGLTIRP